MSFELAGMNGPEHRDIVTLFNNGLIRSRHSLLDNPANQWSSAGIYAYDITDDGKDYLNEHRHLLQPVSP